MTTLSVYHECSTRTFTPATAQLLHTALLHRTASQNEDVPSATIETIWNVMLRQLVKLPATNADAALVSAIEFYVLGDSGPLDTYGAMSTVPNYTKVRSDVKYVSVWVQEITDETATYVIGEQSYTIPVSDLHDQALPWWLLVQDVTFQWGIRPRDQRELGEGNLHFNLDHAFQYDMDQLLSDPSLAGEYLY